MSDDAPERPASDNPAADDQGSRSPSFLVSAAFFAGFAAALVLLWLGLTRPAIEIGTGWGWFFESQRLSILDTIRAFFEDGQIALGCLIFLVSIVFPGGKILTSMALLIRFRPERRATRMLLGALSMISKWSMTDVFILAITVLVVDGRVLTTANLLSGAWCFLTAVVLSTGLSYALLWRANRFA